MQAAFLLIAVALLPASALRPEREEGKYDSQQQEANAATLSELETLASKGPDEECNSFFRDLANNRTHPYDKEMIENGKECNKLDLQLCKFKGSSWSSKFANWLGENKICVAQSCSVNHLQKVIYKDALQEGDAIECFPERR
eukprot:gb/GFBE01057056.1/.p1 GENE.gb/GFBE01057056.1/~~gb/GFBE01057056.1/.p1  ORF type:complete len:142 (+),score=30.42 gb/GFBE01057056.1/:1-426(+)